MTFGGVDSEIFVHGKCLKISIHKICLLYSHEGGNKFIVSMSRILNGIYE